MEYFNEKLLETAVVREDGQNTYTVERNGWRIIYQLGIRDRFTVGITVRIRKLNADGTSNDKTPSSMIHSSAIQESHKGFWLALEMTAHNQAERLQNVLTKQFIHSCTEMTK